MEFDSEPPICWFGPRLENSFSTPVSSYSSNSYRWERGKTIVYPHYETTNGMERTLEVVDSAGEVAGRVAGNMASLEYIVETREASYQIRPREARSILIRDSETVAELVEAWRDVDVEAGILAFLDIEEDTLLSDDSWWLPFVMVWAGQSLFKWDLI